MSDYVTSLFIWNVPLLTNYSLQTSHILSMMQYNFTNISYEDGEAVAMQHFLQLFIGGHSVH